MVAIHQGDGFIQMREIEPGGFVLRLNPGFGNEIADDGDQSDIIPGVDIVPDFDFGGNNPVLPVGIEVAFRAERQMRITEDDDPLIVALGVDGWQADKKD